MIKKEDVDELVFLIDSSIDEGTIYSEEFQKKYNELKKRLEFPVKEGQEYSQKSSSFVID